MWDTAKRLDGCCGVLCSACTSTCSWQHNRWAALCPGVQSLLCHAAGVSGSYRCVQRALLFTCFCICRYSSTPCLQKSQVTSLHVQGPSAAAALRPAPGQRGHAECPGDLPEAHVQVCNGCCQQAGSTKQRLKISTTKQQAQQAHSLAHCHPPTSKHQPQGPTCRQPHSTGAPRLAVHTAFIPHHDLLTLWAVTPGVPALTTSKPPCSQTPVHFRRPPLQLPEPREGRYGAALPLLPQQPAALPRGGSWAPRACGRFPWGWTPAAAPCGCWRWATTWVRLKALGFRVEALGFRV